MKFALPLLFLLPLASLAADSLLPDSPLVLAAMKKAVAFHREKLAVHGGYATAWRKDLSAGKSEHRESKTIICLEPPGVTDIGLALTRAFQVTKDPQFLEAARAAGHCLVECQMATGGWDSDFDFDPEKAKKYHLHQQVLAGDTERGKRYALTTLDDNKTESALLFLVELAQMPECKEDTVLQEAVKFGLDSLVAAQFPNGGWPQGFDGPADPAAPVKKASFPKEWPRKWPNEKYHKFYTLNDDNMKMCLLLMLRAYELTKDERYLASARKAGDFFILAQLPEPQPVWAQQYNRDMEPVWARKFEPPAATGGESLGAMEALLELWAFTGDERYFKPLPPAVAWFDRSRLPDGSYARFYELQTNKPLYCKTGTYELTYDDRDIPSHYSFKMQTASHLEELRALMKKPREEILARHASPTTAKGWQSRAKSLSGKVKTALSTQQPEGYWLKGELIDAGLFVRHLQAMTNYLEACGKN